MFSLVMCLIVIIYSEAKLQQKDNQEISFQLQDEYINDFAVEKDKPLDIILVNFYAKYAWCLNFYYSNHNDQFVAETALNGSSESVINVPKVTDAMITKWWCVVLQEHRGGKYYEYKDHKYTAHDIVFNLHDNVNGPKYIIIYIILSALGLAGVLLVITIILVKRLCCKKPEPNLQLKVNPDNVFYLNLEIFRRQYEREIQAQEPEYEEIL